MKLGTHIYDAIKSKFSYSAIPNSHLWGCGKVFKMADSSRYDVTKHTMKFESICWHSHLSSFYKLILIGDNNDGGTVWVILVTCKQDVFKTKACQS